MSVQQQEGGVDCALFSIAAAYHSAVGDDFRGLTFSQNEMHQHLVECFEHKQLSAFPQTSVAVARNARKHLFVHIHCECQPPDSYDSNMIECERCNHWFHSKCVKLRKQVPETWYCKDCKWNTIYFTYIIFCYIVLC